MVEWRPTRPNHCRAGNRRAAASRCGIPPSAGAAAASAAGNAAQRGGEPTAMDDLDPAAGAMPTSGENSVAQPSGGRRRGRPKGSRNKAALALEAVLEGNAEELVRLL